VQQWKERARKYREQSGAVKTNEATKRCSTNHQRRSGSRQGRRPSARNHDGREDSDRRLKSAETALKQAEQSIAAERKDLHTQHAAKKKELDAALAEREPAIAPIPEDLRVLYERIGKRHHGIALAEARDGQCRGCGMRVLTPHPSATPSGCQR